MVCVHRRDTVPTFGSKCYKFTLVDVSSDSLAWIET